MNILDLLIKAFNTSIRDKKNVASISTEDVAQRLTDLAKKTVVVPLLDPDNPIVTYPLGFEGRDPDFNTYLARQDNVTGNYNDITKWKPTGTIGAAAEWGVIEGDIEDQADLVEKFATKIDKDNGLFIFADDIGIPNGVDDTDLVQLIHDTAVGLGGATVYWPKRKYFIQGTVYLNKPDIVPLNWVGFAPEIVKDDNTGTLISTEFYKPTDGVMFMVNLRESGAPATEWYDYTRNFSMQGFVFRGTMDHTTEAMRMYRIRCAIKACLFHSLDGGMIQEPFAPDGFANTSTSTNTISAGEKTFTVAIAGLPYHVGLILRATSGGNTLTGRVVSYIGTTLVLNISSTGFSGSGTYSSWTIAMVWDNYCDQSSYKLVQFYNAKAIGMRLTSGDVNVLEQIYYTYPSDEAMYAIDARGCQNMTLNGFLHADPSGASMPAGSSMIRLTRMDGFVIHNLTLERPQFDTVFEITQCKGWHISGIRPKFSFKTLLKTSRCRNGTFSHVSTEANLIDGYVDLEDDLSDPSLGMVFDQLYLNVYPPDQVRDLTSNRVFSDQWKRVEYGDKANIVAEYDYGVTPGTANYYIPNNCVLTLPDASQDTLLQFPPTLMVGSEVTIINKNTTDFRITTVQGINLPSGSTFSYFPKNSIAHCKAVHGVLESKTGTISCSTASPTITGTGTSFSSYLKTGMEIFDASGVLIGTARDVANTSITLFSNASMTLTDQPFTAKRVMWFLMGWKGMSNENILAKTASYAISTSDINPYESLIVYADASAGDVLITLPSITTGANKKITLVRVDNSANELSLRASSSVINSSIARFLRNQYDQVTVTNNGTQWYGEPDFQYPSAYSDLAYSASLSLDVQAGNRNITAVTADLTATITGLSNNYNKNKLNFIVNKTTSNIIHLNISLSGAILINDAKDAELLDSDSFVLFGDNASKYLVSITQEAADPIVRLTKIARDGNAPNNFWELTRDFENTTNGNEYPFLQSISGTGATSGSAIALDPTNGRSGIKIFETGTTSTGRASISTNGQTLLMGGGGSIFKTSIRIPVISGGAETHRLRIGFGDSNSADFADGVYFDVADNISCATASNSVGTVVLIEATTTNWTDLMIIVSASGNQAKFYINKVLATTITNNIPIGAGRYTGLAIQFTKESGTTNALCYVDYIHARKLFISPR